MMTYTLTINSESKEALAFLKYAKSLDFVKVKKEKKEELTDEDKDFIKKLSKKTKKLAAKRFYAKIGAI